MNRTPVASDSAASRWIVAAALLWLVLAVLGTGFAALVMLFNTDYSESSAYQVVICVTAAAFGASLSALAALAWRVSRERGAVADGGFAAPMAARYVVQPVLGAGLGLLVYVLIDAIVLLTVHSTEEITLDALSLLLLSALAGFVADTLVLRIRDAMNALFGRRAGDNIEDRRDPPPASPRDPAAGD